VAAWFSAGWWCGVLLEVTPELVRLLAECPRGSGDLTGHALGFVVHGIYWLNPEEAYPSCSSWEAVEKLPRGGWPRWAPSAAQAAHDRTRRQGRGRPRSR
jgi:hypothetical protein